MKPKGALGLDARYLPTKFFLSILKSSLLGREYPCLKYHLRIRKKALTISLDTD
jgi:hypothetical protein